VIWDGTGEGHTARVPIYTWKEFMALGKDVPDADVRKRIDGGWVLSTFLGKKGGGEGGYGLSVLCGRVLVRAGVGASGFVGPDWCGGELVGFGMGR
jgi:hypothetical protein